MSAPAVSAIDIDRRHADDFFQKLDRLMGACIGVIAIRTREPERCKNLIHEWASIREMDFACWNPVTGFLKYKAIPITDVGEGERPQIKTADDMSSYLTPLNKLDAGTVPADNAWKYFAERSDKKEDQKNRFCGTFVGLNQQVLDHAGVQQHIRDHVQRAYQSDDRAFMILQPGITIPAEIANEVELLDLHTPSFAELREILSEMDDNIADQLGGITLSDDEKTIIVQNGMGMTQQEFENAIALSIMDSAEALRKNKKFEVTVDHFVKTVRERKLEILKSTQILELMPTSKVEDVGGLDLLIAFLRKRAQAFRPGAREFGIKPPKGFIVVGPPGGGKSLVTEVVCSIFGQAGIRFDIGRVFGSFIGQSEERMRMALGMLEDMAPCIVQIEEIEKALGGGGGGGDGGTGERVIGTLLTWMADRTARGIPITIVASANDVTKIRPELLRKGRFDAIFGIGLPTIEERIAILKIHAKKRGHSLTDDEYRRLAKATDTYVGAELEAIVEEALFDDFADGNEGLTYANALKAAEGTIPQVKLFPERIAQMTAWVKDHGRPASSGSTFDVANEGPLPKVRRRGGKGLKLKSASAG